jgi:hypothetical protein
MLLLGRSHVSPEDTMKITKKQIKAVAKAVAARADAALVDAGKAAERRQRTRAVKATLKKAGKAVLIAGAVVAAVAAARKRRPVSTTA